MLREPCLCPERIVLEAGTLSFWLARGLRKRGQPDQPQAVCVLCAFVVNLFVCARGGGV